MKYILTVYLLVAAGINLSGQNQAGTEEGSVSFVTTQNVYVKFSNTSSIRQGDTLFISKDGNLVPALIVKDLSSISCVCVPVNNISLKVSDRIIFKASRPVPPPPAPVTPPKPGDTSHQVAPVTPAPVPPVPPPAPDTTGKAKIPYKTSRQQIHGFVNVASYTDWSNNPSTSSQREKLTFGFRAKNIANTNLSAECLISYYINPKQYNEISNSVFNQLKIYNFDFNYDFGTKVSLLLGRKINPKLSSMGPNDGLMLELKFKPLSVGVIAGFRPDYRDWGFNGNLFQAGAYLYNEYGGKNGFMQSTLAFINQSNSWKTDRRFFYLQHSNNLVKNLAFYGSFEMDIYGMKFNSTDSTYTSNSTPRVTNLYLSLSYRMFKKVFLSFSYNNRQNVIYYESYKTFLDRLLDTRILQGYSFQVSYTPITYLSVGGTATYRFQKVDPRPTKNAYIYVSYSRIPAINTGVTVSVIFLGTGYVDGKIYSAGLSKDLAKGKLYLGLTYRYVDYHYYNPEIPYTYQNMGEFNLTWRIIRKLSLSVYYEGTFEKTTYNRIYAQANWAF